HGVHRSERRARRPEIGPVLRELGDEPEDAAVRVEGDLTKHPENTRNPRSHLLAPARGLLGAGDEMAHESLLGELHPRNEALHLRVGRGLRTRDLGLDVASLTAERDADHREHRAGILLPAGSRELRLAYGA